MLALISIIAKILLRLSLEKNKTEDLIHEVSLLRIFFNAMQLFAFLKSLPVEWPSSIKGILSFNEIFAVISSHSIHLDCMMSPHDESSGINKGFLKLLLFNFFPYILITMSAIGLAIYFIKKRQSLKKNLDFRVKIKVIILAVLFYFDFAILNDNLSAFSCVNLYREDWPVYFVKIDYDTECWSTSHFLWIFFLVLPSLILWGISLPYFLLKNNQEKDGEDNVKNGLIRFFYLGLTESKKKKWLFFQSLLRTLMILIVKAISSFSAELRIYLVYYMLWVLFLLHIKEHPYKMRIHNTLEQSGLFICILITSGGIMLATVKKNDFGEVFSAVKIIITNLLFSTYILREFSRRVRLVERLKSIKNIFLRLKEYKCRENCLKIRKINLKSKCKALFVRILSCQQRNQFKIIAESETHAEKQTTLSKIKGFFPKIKSKCLKKSKRNSEEH